MAPDTDNPNNPNDQDPENFDPESTEGQTPQDEEEAELEKEFAALLDQHLPADKSAPRGELMEFTIVAVRNDIVLVDMGGKAEAGIMIDEFPTVDGIPTVRVGDTIPVVQIGRNEDGTPRLSYRQARARLARKDVSDALENKVPLTGVITRVVKGGVMVDVGLDAFMPASQIDLFKIPDLNTMVGKEIEALVLEFDPRRNRAVLTRRELLFQRRNSERTDFLEKLTPGETITGKVKSTLDFGVFVDLEIVDGFIPREEVSWDRGKAPGDVLKVGEEVEVKILNVSTNSGKVTLSRKRLEENPWDEIEARFPVGSTVQGEVVAIQSYGAFVHIEEGITGMIHAGDMSWATGNKKPEDYVRLGDTVTSQVVEIDKKKKRLSLGLKQLSRDP